MEVIVDDTQLSLAIGKKGQNVRLAAKLLGWRIDIKSEEEKRQEVESQMAALVVPGAPVAVLLDHGLAEEVVEKLMAAEVSTVERLGSMTPEELDAIGIGADMVEQIQLAVNGYYGQFESPTEDAAEAAVDGAEAAAEPSEASSETSGEATPAATTEANAAETGGEKPEIENESVTIKNTEGSGEGEVRSV
jgi:N utilization substance protein A